MNHPPTRSERERRIRALQAERGYLAGQMTYTRARLTALTQAIELSTKPVFTKHLKQAEQDLTALRGQQRALNQMIERLRVGLIVHPPNGS